MECPYYVTNRENERNSRGDLEILSPQFKEYYGKAEGKLIKRILLPSIVAQKENEDMEQDLLLVLKQNNL
jgi:hypothetical protein